jgi:hypothetical protein
MHQPDGTEVTRETTQLLNELDDALLHSSALREIHEKYAELRRVESLTGPSRLTRKLRSEIRLLESRLCAVRT